MKRIFINRVLAFLLIGATLTYAGCKDYDDDIGNVQTELSETAAALQEQLGALQTALTGAQNEAAAATQKAAAAKEAADEAAETAAAAQKAVADAKTEAIREAISQCQSLISDKADQSALDELASQIEGIEKNLSQTLKDYATIDDMQKFEKALEVQQKALEKYADELGDKASSADRKHPQECDRPGNPRKGREGPERRDHEKSGRTAFLAQRRTLIPADERDAGSRPLCRRNPHDRVPVRIVQCPDDQSGR